MTIERKVGMGIAGQPSGATDVADVFSTYLYTGNNSTQTITNGIDLDGEGGLTWIKGRTAGYGHNLYDTERGATNSLASSSTDTNAVKSDGLTAFNSNGFSLGSSGSHNTSGQDYASFTFRKKSGFFDCVTWTGNGVAGREISHGLNGPVGMMVVKNTSHARSWTVFHKSLGATKYVYLNTQDPAGTYTPFWNDTAPTDTAFTLGINENVNGNGNTYVAYLWADNSSEDAEEQMIKCGSYTGNGSATGPVVDLGWEPQFLITKVVNSNNWNMWDSMRGITAGAGDARLYPNLTNAEDVSEKLQLTPTGFQIKSTSISINTSGVDTIYMAIRAPMMQPPSAATDVFNTQAYTGGGEGPVAGFKTDFSITGLLSGSDKFYTSARITGSTTLKTNTNAAEAQQGASAPWDRMDGNMHTDSSGYSYWAWQRAKGYMDAVCYSGNSTAGRTVAHSLGVVPEMIWVKCRSDAENWMVYSDTIGANDYLTIQNNSGKGTYNTWNGTAPTDSVFSLSSIDEVNGSGKTFVAYLFATLAGISKVGSFVGNGSSQTISCGFSAGSRYILIKRTDATGDWYFWDSLRGIVAGNDPHVSLNTTAAQVTNDDSVDPHNSGFIVNQVSATNINVSSATYIFYAIA